MQFEWGVRCNFGDVLCKRMTVPSPKDMANAQPAAAEQQDGQPWWRTGLNFVAIYFAVNALSGFVGGKYGAQKDVSGTDGGVKPAAVAGANEVPALWSLGTKMVVHLGHTLTVGHADLP
jgi:membrane associated rhomboid family serine protease